MAFYGCEFSFDGKSSREMGLMVYNFGSTTQGDASFTSAGSIVEDKIAGRYDTFFYGVEQNESLTYTLVFGLDTYYLDRGIHLDRFDVESMASWLTGHNSRKWLEISQPDMETFRYKCVISELQLITYGELPWAFSCKVTCDSPFAYTHPEVFLYDVQGALTDSFFNRSTYNGYFKPRMIITTSGGGSIFIKNKMDGDRVFAFENLPSGDLRIIIDNQNQVIYEENHGLNMYSYFNFNFMRLIRGENILEFEGDCVIEFICEFPVNIGA